MRRTCFARNAVLVLWILAFAPSWGVNEKGDWPWNLKLHGWHDRAVAEDLGNGWFMARSEVWLAKVGSDSSLVFQAMRGGKQAAFQFEVLTAKDHAGLARLAAGLRPDDPEAQALAGIYLELSGDTATADDYYKRAGPDLGKTLDELFE